MTSILPELAQRSHFHGLVYGSESRVPRDTVPAPDDKHFQETLFQTHRQNRVTMTRSRSYGILLGTGLWTRDGRSVEGNLEVGTEGRGADSVKGMITERVTLIDHVQRRVWVVREACQP